jgi:hypothetical protein
MESSEATCVPCKKEKKTIEMSTGARQLAAAGDFFFSGKFFSRCRI